MDLRFPLLATTSKHELFQYMLLKLQRHSALIALPEWMIYRTAITQGDRIDLYLASYFSVNAFEDYSSGTVTVLETKHSHYGTLCCIEFDSPLNFDEVPQDASFNELVKLLSGRLKDSLFLKCGIEIFIKHLGPFFSRISTLTFEKYSDIKTFLFNDILHQIEKKIIGLELLHKQANNQISDIASLVETLDLEFYRDMVQSEIVFMLFDLVFSEGSKENIIRRGASPSKSCHAYLEAIKLLEQKLYSNFNAVAQLYAQAIRSWTQNRVPAKI